MIHWPTRMIDRWHGHDGLSSFSALASGSESDLRFVFCAAAISSLLNDWSGVDIDRATNYILSCQV